MLLRSTTLDNISIGCYINLAPIPSDVRQLLGTAIANPTVAGVLEVDVTHWDGTAVAAPTVAGVPEVDVTHLVGVSQSATDLKDFADAGYDPSTNKVQGVVLTDTVTTYTGNTPQTGDSFARIGATGSGLTSLASQASVDAVPTAAENADAVWDEDATGHQTQGTFGQAIGDPAADTNTLYKAVVTDAAGATLVSAALLLARGSAAIVEAPDVLGAQAAEAPDTMAGTGRAGVTGVGQIAEAPDAVTGVGSIESGEGGVTEAPDVLEGTGVVTVTGAGASDIPAATGLGVPKISAARVTFTLNTSPGLQVISHPANQNGTPFLGNFFLFASVGGSGISAGISQSFGAAVAVPIGGGSVQQWATFASVLDGASVADAADGGDDTKCIEFVNTGAATTEAAAFVSSAIGQFTINITTAGAGRTMECLVLGGTGIQAAVGHYSNSPAGDRVISTDVSNGKALLLARGTDTEGSGRITSATGHLSIGAASSPNSQWAITARSAEDRTTGSLTASVNDDDRCFGSLKFSVLEYRVSESLISLGPSSFTVRPQPAGATGGLLCIPRGRCFLRGRDPNTADYPAVAINHRVRILSHRVALRRRWEG